MAGQWDSSCPLEQNLIDARILFNHLLMAVHIRDNFGISRAGPVPGLIPPLVGLAHGIDEPIQQGTLKGSHKGLGKGAKKDCTLYAARPVMPDRASAVPGAKAGKGNGKGCLVIQAAAPVPAAVRAVPHAAARSRSRSR
jgi:hypothetical protein